MVDPQAVESLERIGLMWGGYALGTLVAAGSGLGRVGFKALCVLTGIVVGIAAAGWLG